MQWFLFEIQYYTHPLSSIATEIHCPWVYYQQIMVLLLKFTSFYACISNRFFTSPISGRPLTIADLATVINELFPCRAKWYDLGIQLRVDVSTLDSFKVQYDDPSDELREVLKSWLATGGNPTWGVMVEALKRPAVGQARLAVELQQKYCTCRQPPKDGE